VIAVVAAAGLIGAFVAFRFGSSEPPEPAATPPPPAQPRPVVTKPAATLQRDRERKYTESLIASSLSSPERAVESAVKFLQIGDQESWKSTFLPTVQADLAADAFEKCRAYVERTRVLPDWETAQTATVDGHPVKRVSMFGKSLTGFHQIGASWYADRVWCLPTGVP
jgi:hypothetical protein